MKFQSSFLRTPFWLLLSFLTIAGTACQKQETSTPIAPEEKSRCSCEHEVAFKDTPGETITLKDNKGQTQMQFVKKGDKYIMDGDMIFTKEQVETAKKILLQPSAATIPHSPSLPHKKTSQNARRVDERKHTGHDGEQHSEQARTGINSLVKIWPNRTIFYTIHPSVQNPWEITDAIAHWENETNLNFVVRTSQANYVEFVTEDLNACWSFVGMIGGRQALNVGVFCTAGNIIHEIGHAIGFYHEQSRADRNNFITVHTANIEPGAEGNFLMYTAMPGASGFEIGTFDFNSIMLYDSYAFSSNTLPTITRLDNSVFTAQRTGLSAGDIETYNVMYNPVYGRVEYDDVVTWQWNPDYETTEGDIYLRFYADPACTIPASPNPTYRIDYWLASDGGWTTGWIKTSSPSNFLWREQFLDVWQSGVQSATRLHLESYMPGCIDMGEKWTFRP